jgi:ligand-binding sensor domain-containing protein/DNA-binding CsgD family transcriptional regulator
MRTRPSKRVFLFLATLLTSLASAAPLWAHTFSTVGTANGLKARVITSLLVDRDGFLWVGAREGLFRFDGYETLAFLPDAADPNAISDADVRYLFQDGEGVVWAGTSAGGLNRYDPDSGRFRKFAHDPSDPASLARNGVIAISDGPNGGLWVATESALSRLDRASGRFRHFRNDPGDPGSLSAGQPGSLHLGASGRLWAGTVGGGLNLWNPEEGSFRRFDLAELAGGPPELNDVYALYEGPDGSVWAGTRIGLVLVDPDRGTARELPLEWVSEYAPAVSAMAPDRHGRLWLGTLAHGVLIVDMESREWETDYDKLHGPVGHLTDQPLTSVALSADMVFVGTWSGGVYRSTSHTTAFEWLNEAGGDGLRNQNVTAVMASDEPGRPWLGTHGGGPQRAGIVSHRVDDPPGLSEDLRAESVFRLVPSAEGEVLAGTMGGLFRFSETEGQLEHIAYERSNPGAMGQGSVRDILAGEDGRWWIGMAGSGVSLLDRESGEFRHLRHSAEDPDSLSSDSVTVLLDDGPDHLWVGTRSAGLNRCRVGEWNCRRFSADDDDPGALGHPNVASLFRAADGAVWAATGGGLHRLEREADGRVSGFKRWTRDDGLLDDGLLAIEEDDDGSLWLSTRVGLSRFDPASGRIRNYVAESGLPVTHFNANASARDDRYLYFGSIDGLLGIPRGSAFAEREPSKVRITTIQRAAAGGRQQRVFWPEGELSVPYREVLTIRFASLDLSESAHEYAYRVQPDEPWTAIGSQRQLILHGLSPGRYAFQVRGRDVFGQWGQSEPLVLDVVPPWWMTESFRALVVLALILLALAIHFSRQAVLKRRSREIQRLSEKREQALEQKLGSEAELAVLTPRQKEILQLIAEGYSTREIADLLGVSIKTVEAHRANLMDRLDIRDVPGLVRLAIRSGLVSEYD